MSRQPVYHEGRFTVPPRFDFKFLPLRGKRVTVISFLGHCDFFLGVTQFSDVFAYTGRSVPFPACVDGYYDCENQIVFLVFNSPDSDVFEVKYSASKESKIGPSHSESTCLKLWFYAFSISHFVVLTSLGTNLDPQYLRTFKILNQLRNKMRHPIEECIKDLPLPREWLNTARAAIPRLLFVFRLKHAQYQRLSKDTTAVRKLERNIVSQIFTTFYELDILNKRYNFRDGKDHCRLKAVNVRTPNNQLFLLPGHNFVHVQLGNEYVDSFGLHVSTSKETSQKYLEQISDVLGISAKLNISTNVCANQQVNCSRDKYPTAWDFPCPDQPNQHTLSAFLRMHVKTMLDQISSQDPTSDQSPVTFKLPTCKAWFMTCYKLYTNLISEDNMPNAPQVSDKATSRAESSTQLTQAWKDALTSILLPSTVSTSTLSSRYPTHPKHTSGDEDFNPLNNPNLSMSEYLQHLLDPISRLSISRYLVASNMAELHYKQGLPLHYSCTYHLVRVISAFNIAISLTRGQYVFNLLRKLCSRLVYLYLAGRVTCSARSLTGHSCQYELHRLPDQQSVLLSILSSMSKREKCEATEHLEDKTNLSGKAASANPMHSMTFLKLATINLIPTGLVGKWRHYWIVSAINALNLDGATDQSTLDSQSNIRQDETVEQNSETKQLLAVMPHRSNVVLVSSCSCGRQQAIRLDPFHYREANWGFYSPLANLCCNKLNSIDLAPQFLSKSNHTFCLPNNFMENFLKTKFPNAGDIQDLAATTTTASGTTTTSGGVGGATAFDDQLERNKRTGREPTGKMSSLSPTLPLLEQEHLDQQSGLSQPDCSDLSLSVDSDQSDSIRGNELHKSSSDSSCSESDRKRSAADIDASGDELIDLCTSDNSSKRSDRRSRAINKSEMVRYPSPKPKDTLAEKPTDTTQSLCPVVFRDGVPTTSWKVGDFPRYPSWSIYTLGKYFSYSHSSGLPCPGFLRNSNYLLPWDVVIGSSSYEERSSNSVMNKYRPGRTDSGVVKLFIGFEMECTCGHRFFITGPDRAMDGPMQSSQVRRAVQGLLTGDLPIYMPCPCHRPGLQEFDGEREMAGSSTSGQTSSSTPGQSVVWAQLSRIYLAIPSAPIRIRFEPRIRPGPAHSTPIFHLGPTLDQCYEETLDSVPDSDNELLSDSRENIHLNARRSKAKSSSRQSKCAHPRSSGDSQKPGFVLLDNGFFWVIRLPFIYFDGTTLYEKPSDPAKLGEWKFLRGSMQLQM